MTERPPSTGHEPTNPPAHPDELAPEALELQPGVRLVLGDGLDFLASLPRHSVHAVVTDPPYALVEYEAKDHAKLRKGRGGVWRIPPTLDGVTRSPVPRFTVLTEADKQRLDALFARLGEVVAHALVPGGHLLCAATPLLSSRIFVQLEQAGLHKRGEIIRLVQTLRGGDRPKGAHQAFRDVTVMPRAGWEPWGLFRSALDGTVANTLRTWGTGGLRRVSDEQPFRDVIPSGPTPRRERQLSSHPSLKPQAFLRQVVRASLPLGVGVVVDPFAGSASTLAAAASLGYHAIGVERDVDYVRGAVESFEALRDLSP